MKHSFDYPAWELHPRKLSEEEAADPYLVLADFFDYASLPQVRDKLWAWLEATVTGDFSKGLGRKERSNMILFYLHVEKLVEAIHLMHQKKPRKKEKQPKKK